MRRRQLFSITALVLVGVAGAGCASSERTTSSPRLTHERLHGVLWAQTAAEYHAAHEQAYLLAQERLDQALQDPTWTAALEQDNQFSMLPSAVIVDIDETVLSNAAFQAQLVKNNVDYDPVLWSRWTGLKSALGTPGVQKFLQYAKGKGVRIVYITGRKDAEEPDTRANLTKLGLPVDSDADAVLSKGEYGSTSDKTAHRRRVAQTHRILLLIGDDLNDFVSGALAPASPEDRVKLAAKYQAYWGRKWILMPNALYGSWEQSLYPSGLTDADILKRKYEIIRGFE